MGSTAANTTGQGNPASRTVYVNILGLAGGKLCLPDVVTKTKARYEVVHKKTKNVSALLGTR